MRRASVSVAMVTFQQETFVGEALRTALEQDLQDVEVIVGDDASRDGTMEIVREWEARHPGRVKVLPHASKLGQRANYLRTMQACSGTYISQLDGDDFFLSASKLRRQVEFLDENDDCSGCFTASQEVDESSDAIAEIMRPPGLKARYTSEDFSPVNLANSSAVMFRRGLFGDHPAWFRSAPVADWPLHQLNLQYGDYGYIDENLAAHRRHAAGIWVGKTQLQRLRTNLGTQACFLAHLNPETIERIRPIILAYQFCEARRFEKEGELTEAREILRWLRKQSRKAHEVPTGRLWSRSLRVGLKSLLAPSQVQ